ncbi:hypothetical protein [Sphingomonas sp.]|uniref:hypothetical protein n=1 Tax=Sphingomonas sp. TaxID=28214 RepID=UPI00286E8411|nr:hypothetical protein [Sphingomonas sp.]
MRPVLTLIVAAAVLPAAPAWAGDKKPKDPTEIVCKRERFVGSNRTEKICKPRLEWEHERTDSQRLLDTGRNLRVDKPIPGGG